MSRTRSFLTFAASCIAIVAAAGGAHAQTSVPFSTYFTYTKSINNLYALNGELMVKVCDESGSGTDSSMSLTIESTTGGMQTIDLNLPGDDLRTGETEYYAFPFPNMKVNDLKAFWLEIHGSDALCIEEVTLWANNGLVASYDAATPLAGDRMFRVDGSTSSFNGDGSGVVWLSTDDDEGMSELEFSEEWGDMTVTIPGGTLRFRGYYGLPLKRSTRWRQLLSNISNEVANSAASLPFLLTIWDIDTQMKTYFGDAMAGTPMYWGDGYVRSSIKSSTSNSVTFHVDAKLKVEVDYAVDPVLLGDLDVTVTCGLNEARTKTGLTFKASKPKFVVDAGGVLGATFDLFDVDIHFSIKAPKPVFVETRYCPSNITTDPIAVRFSWPTLFPEVKTTWIDGPFGRIPTYTTTMVAAPINPLAINPASIQLR